MRAPAWRSDVHRVTASGTGRLTRRLRADRHGQQILAAWIGKEKLRDALNLRAAVTRSTPCERDVRGRLASFYDRCAQNASRVSPSS